MALSRSMEEYNKRVEGEMGFLAGHYGSPLVVANTETKYIGPLITFQDDSYYVFNGATQLQNDSVGTNLGITIKVEATNISEGLIKANDSYAGIINNQGFLIATIDNVLDFYSFFGHFKTGTNPTLRFFYDGSTNGGSAAFYSFWANFKKVYNTYTAV